MTFSRTSRRRVPTTEMRIEPKHPSPLEKKTNIPPRYPPAPPISRVDGASAAPSSRRLERDPPPPLAAAAYALSSVAAADGALEAPHARGR
jgi:hypothetical protein